MKWVVAQFVLIGVIVVALFVPPRPNLFLVGVPLAVAGAALGTWSAVALGPALTPLPTPRGPLVVDGPYRFLRHPMYVAGLLLLAGLSLAFSWIALALSGALAVLWFFKSRVEEVHLAERFPEYAEYRRRVRF